jgi:hypothetical protein
MPYDIFHNTLEKSCFHRFPNEFEIFHKKEKNNMGLGLIKASVSSSRQANSFAKERSSLQ